MTIYNISTFHLLSFHSHTVFKSRYEVLALFFSVIFYTKVSYFGLFEHTDNKAFSHTFGASCNAAALSIILDKK